jgi:hypothetical protein
MRKIAQILMCLTLWCDLCLMLGVVLTGHHGKTTVSALIRVGDFSVDSNSPGGAAFIVVIAAWTGALALSGLCALLKGNHQNASSNP